MLAAVTVQAAEIEPYSCRNGLFPSEQTALALYTVTGPKAQKLYFYNDDEGCPYDEARCRLKSYVIPGDDLLVNKVAGDWACVWYSGKQHESVGWVKKQLLASVPVQPPQMADWVGRWRIYKWVGGIDITRKGGVLSVEGKATWNGGKNRYGESNIHYGDISGEIKPEKGRARLFEKDRDSDGGCGAEFTRIGQYLVVHDNNRCGGMNVSFSGVYIRNPTARAISSKD